MAECLTLMLLSYEGCDVRKQIERGMMSKLLSICVKINLYESLFP